MEPLSALGLVGNVVQFVDFASGLIRTVSEITTSASGASNRTLELETVYKRLQTFTATLSQTQGHAGSRGNTAPTLDHGVFTGGLQHDAQVEGHATAIEAMAGECKLVCDRLLVLVDSLRLKPAQAGKAGHWIKATVAALKTVFAEKKIAEMEESLKRLQTMIGLHFLPLIDAKLSDLFSIMQDITSSAARTSTDHTARLDKITGVLESLPRNTSSVSLPLAFGVTEDDACDSGSGGLVNMFLQLSMAEKDINTIMKEQSFVNSLRYSDRMNRYEAIPEAHAATFQWMFEPAAPRKGISVAKSELLQRWLSSGSGTFWVTGKPGSGKSTFMKFVADHEKTIEALERWAEPNKVVTAMHYFWNAGTSMQKSIRGLLQSLLYAVLECQPDLVSVVFPTQWQNLWKRDLRGTKDWTIKEMRAGLEALAEHPDMTTKFCFFIDGLDEFDGNYTDEYEGLCQLLDKISSSPHLKCCVSSRPWNVFANAFDQNPASTLYIHEVTFQDITNYTRSRLASHLSWEKLHVPPEVAEDFILSITERAKGVFLWVFLVTTSLRNGLINGDTIDDLQRRLNSLPTEIEPFYKHMLDLVEPTDYRYMSRTLRLAFHPEARDLWTYYAREFEDKNSNYALDQPPEPDMVPPNIPESRLESCRCRINARCGGLLGLDNNRVEFIHRTARDFLETQSMKDYLRDKAGGDHYNIEMAYIKTHVYFYRCLLASPGCDTATDRVHDRYRECIEHVDDALEADKEYGLLLFSTFTDTPEDRAVRDPSSVREFLLARMAASDTRIHTTSTRSTNSTPSELGLLGPYMQHHFFDLGQHKYISAQLERNPSFFRNMPDSPMGFNIKDDRRFYSQVKIRKALLNAGYDANEPVGNSTAWLIFMSGYLSGSQAIKKNIIGFNAGFNAGESLMITYLKNGADRTQRIAHKHRSDPSTSYQPMLFPLTHIFLDIFKATCSNPPSIKDFVEVIDTFLESETIMQLDELVLNFPRVPQCAPVGVHIMPLRKAARKAAVKTIIAKGNSVGVDMQSLAPGILAYFEDSEGESIVSLIAKKPRRDIDDSGENHLPQPKQEQTPPPPGYSKTPKRALQDEPGEAEQSPKGSKRARERGSRQKKKAEADNGCMEVVEISDMEVIEISD